MPKCNTDEKIVDNARTAALRLRKYSMAKAAISAAEFIELWNTHRSASKIADILKQDVRTVQNRRRGIEQRFKISLTSVDSRASAFKEYETIEHFPRREFGIETGKVLVFSDAHFWPGIRTTAYRALLQFIRQIRPDAIINNGDAFDGASISRHPRINWTSVPSVVDELHACKQRLGEIEDAAGKASLYWCLGNHDSRFESRLSANVPEYAGVKGVQLRDHFTRWGMSWSVWINDTVVVKHRGRGGYGATRLNTLNAGKTMVTGHLHSLKVTPLDDYNGTRWGVDTGTLADPKGPQFRDYLEDGATDWRSGFVLLSFFNGTLLQPETIRVVDEHHVDFRGALVKVDP